MRCAASRRTRSSISRPIASRHAPAGVRRSRDRRAVAADRPLSSLSPLIATSYFAATGRRALPAGAAQARRTRRGRYIPGVSAAAETRRRARASRRAGRPCRPARRRGRASTGASTSAGSTSTARPSTRSSSARGRRLRKPLVFVHGLSGSWPNWLEQLPVFAREHRVIALDLPGFGHSPMPAREALDRRLRAPARRAARPLWRSTPRRVVGNSMGGFIAPSWRSPSPSASSASCSCPPPASPRTTTARLGAARCRRCAGSSASAWPRRAWAAAKSDAVAAARAPARR